MSKKIPTPSLFDAAVSAVALLRKHSPYRNTGRIPWKLDPGAAAMVVAAIMSNENPDEALMRMSSATGASRRVLYNLTRGADSSGQKWPALRSAVEPYGFTWDESGKNTLTPPTIIDRLNALANQTLDATKPEAIAPVADDAPPAKFTVLAVTANGNVEPATLPTAATTPKAMVAGAGDFFMATPGLQVGACVGLAGALAIEPVTGDCFVTTTERVCYGTARWCELMRDHATKKAAPSA